MATIQGKVVAFQEKSRAIFFTLLCDDGRKIEQTSSIKIPLEVGDFVYIHEPGARPFVMVGSDIETIKDFFARLHNNRKKKSVSKIYEIFSYLQKYVQNEDKELFPFLSDLAWIWGRLNKYQRRNRLGTPTFCDELYEQFSFADVDLIFTSWYRQMIHRQYLALGLTRGEIERVIRLLCFSNSLHDLFPKFVQDPYLFFCLPIKKLDLLAANFADPNSPDRKLTLFLSRKHNSFISGHPLTFTKEEQLQIENFYPKDLLISFQDQHYFRGYFQIEKQIAQALLARAKAGPYSLKTHKIDLSNLSEDQILAYQGVCKSSVSVLTGSAGTGKTTLIEKILETFEASGFQCRILSFTGKAVARLKEVLKRTDPVTIHYLLRKTVDNGDVDTADTCILDECSMIPTELLCRLITALPNCKRYLFVGDVNQLTPIEWGRPFWDIIESGAIPVYRLKLCHRVTIENGEKDGILENANGLFEQGSSWKLIPRKNFHVYEDLSPLTLLQTIAGTIAPNDITILCPFRASLPAINDRASELFFPSQDEFQEIRSGKKWRVGDRVMNLTNDYQHKIMNGDEGVLSAIFPEGNEFTKGRAGVLVTFGTNSVFFQFEGISIEADEKEEIDEDEEIIPSTKYLERCYAITIHKAQGSQWKYVVLYLEPGYGKTEFLSQNLLYTALTRARRGLWILGSPFDIANMADTPVVFGADALPKLLTSA